MAAVCTPEGLIRDSYPCFECLSESELLAVLLLSINELLGTYDLPEELSDLFADSACFTCLSDKQKLQAVVSGMAAKAYERTDKTMEEIRDEAKCMLCASPGAIKAALVLMLCNLTNGYTAPQ
jgi:hypothetical protein